MKKLFTKKNITIMAALLAASIFIFIASFNRPDPKELVSLIPKEFVADAGSRYALTEQNYYAFNIARGKNLRTGRTMTFIGFMGKLYELPEEGAFRNLSDIILWLPALVNGTKITIALTMAAVSAGLVGSIFLALGKISSIKPLSAACSAYIFFFRGTPLLMQLFFVYYGLPTISPVLTINNKFLAAFIAFGMNSAAYCAEIIRAAILSIDKGQFEASQTLGHSYAQTMSLIIMPQAIRRLIPPVANEFIMVIKDASLVSMIALTDLTHVTRSISSSSATALVYLPAMAIYLIITAFFTYLFNKLEERFSVYY
ncbi:MAG: amino acid ABC transporter permease [Eubacteriaceae bacterium]|nr:amino acid ABC transporter permease [Eubacteriaceae bacterium]